MTREGRDLTGREVVFLVGVLERAGVRLWLDGGWAVDAVVGRQTRVHDDLDLVMVADDIAAALVALEPLHFAIHEDNRPVSLVLLDHARRQIDIHPIELDGKGTGWQRRAMPDGSDASYPAAQLGSGMIGGRPVPSKGPQLQVAHHTGYEPRDHDRADIAVLCETFGLELPPAYRTG
jgi:lincosamide nucleotidyltransferase A/C/D/E